ncbi:hypothetical protein GGR52DRAFT_484435 [Hypoxylon sp. FL1284]|nr:hypothetical protein GGR52DRAFT_484435 [Hypoxylon sp. FL1284]
MSTSLQTSFPLQSLKPIAMDFYDIAMLRPGAVNPWKARLALNFKAADYTTTWVPLPDIGRVRRELGVPACRKHADGSDFFTLPVLIDRSTAARLGDSFDIAVHLQRACPSSGAGDLFPAAAAPAMDGYAFAQDLPAWAPPLSVRAPQQMAADADGQRRYGAYARFDTHVDRAFSAHVALAGSGLPLDSQASRDELVRRAGVASWGDFEVRGDARKQLVDSLRDMLGGLAAVFARDDNNAGGPFVLGDRPCYADLIVGGWIYMMQATLPEEEWLALKGWHGGVFGRLYDGLQRFAEVK